MSDNSQELEHFSKLLSPVGIDEFLSDYYEQRALYVHRTDETYFADLLSGDDIDRLFVHRAISNSIVRVNKDGQDLHSDRFSRRDGPMVSSDRLLNLFGSGHSIIVNHGGRIFPALDRFCGDVERELRFPVQPNIYLTPFDAQAFTTHFDVHDVIILQVMGSKHWRLFHSPFELPSPRQAWVAGAHSIEAPQMEVTLSAGDSLYIPRGVLHDARTSGVSSAHITFGLHPTYRFDLLQELTYIAQDMPVFRKAMPLGLLRDREAAAREFRDLLTDLVGALDVEKLVERRDAEFVRHRTFDARHRFRDLARLNKLSLDTVVQRRTSVQYRIERDERSITVCFADNRIPVQPFLENALGPILGNAPFAVRGIPGFLTDKNRIDLVRAFLQPGFLEVVELNGVEQV